MHKITTNLISGWLTVLAGTTALALDKPVSPVTPVPLPETNAPGSRIEFATPVYDFGRVKNGDLVKYSFVFTNTGDQLLEVTAVQPSCGCTTAGDWTRKVDPGKTGTVAIQFNSANFNGQVFKTVSVSSNDKQHPVTVLQLKGTIWKPIELLPPYTVMNVSPDVSTASATIKIVNHTGEPLTLSPPVCTNLSFKVTLQTNQPGQEYQVTVASAAPLTSGNVQGHVNIQTSSTNTPRLDIPFWVNVQPAVSIMPRQISLPRAPLTAKSPASVTIQNNSTNAISLTEPTVNAPGVEVQIKEVQPGKVFNALLTFPEGFEVTSGQPVTLTMKSTSPQTPEIHVPVVQAPRTTVAPVPAPKPYQPNAAAPPQPPSSVQVVR